MSSSKKYLLTFLFLFSISALFAQVFSKTTDLPFKVYETKALQLSNDKGKTLHLSSEVAFLKDSQIKIIYTFTNPNSTLDFNAVLPVACKTSDKAAISNNPLPYDFYISVNGKVTDYSFKVGNRNINSGEEIPVSFTFTAEKKSLTTVQVCYSILESSGIVPSYTYNYTFSKNLDWDNNTFYKLYYKNTKIDYYIDGDEVKEFEYISKIDSDEWTFEYDSYFFNENSSIDLVFKQYPKYTDRELAFKLFTEGDLFFLTENQLHSILEVYRQYFYQLTDLQNQNTKTIRFFDTNDYPFYKDDITPGLWIELMEKRLEEERLEAERLEKEKLEAEKAAENAAEENSKTEEISDNKKLKNKKKQKKS